MDKIEDAVAFILAILVAVAPLSMLAESLWRRRETGRYIVEIWNGDHTRLLTTITATSDDELPANGETIVNLQGTARRCVRRFARDGPRKSVEPM